MQFTLIDLLIILMPCIVEMQSKYQKLFQISIFTCPFRAKFEDRLILPLLLSVLLVQAHLALHQK